MDFFARQDEARRKTGLLLAYFALAIVLIVLAVCAVAGAILVYGFGEDAFGLTDPRAASVFLWSAVATIAIIATGSITKTLALNAGGASVAVALGGRPLAPNTNDLAERRLLNVVEEMALASGCTAPSVFVLDNEGGINAFAAGLTPGDAVIAVTSGTVRRLTRSELQGVIAHEFSHILNGDMRLNLRLIGILNGILAIAMVGRGMLRGVGGSRRRGTRVQMRGSGGLYYLVLAVALLALGYIGVFFARLIKSAVSREREYLADASAVQLTRDPSGLAGALKKIGGFSAGSRVSAPRAEEVSHMFFGNALGDPLLRWQATHPPLVERIRRLDPGFDGNFPETPLDTLAEIPGALESAADAPMAGIGGTYAPAKVDAESIVDSIGNPDGDSLARSRELLANFPAPLRYAARDPFGARAVVYTLLLDPDPRVREAQLDTVAEHEDEVTNRMLRSLVGAAGELAVEYRLPLLDLAMPALRDLSDRQRESFARVVDALIRADDRVDVFEYILQRILRRQIGDTAGQRSARPGARQAIEATRLVVSALAYTGSEDDGAATAAFRKGVEVLPGGGKSMAIHDRSDCGIEALDVALAALAGAPPFTRKAALEAAVSCVLADDRATVAEIELIRAVAAAMDCPVPPLALSGRDAGGDATGK